MVDKHLNLAGVYRGCACAIAGGARPVIINTFVATKVLLTVLWLLGAGIWSISDDILFSSYRVIGNPILWMGEGA